MQLLQAQARAPGCKGLLSLRTDNLQLDKVPLARVGDDENPWTSELKGACNPGDHVYEAQLLARRLKFADSLLQCSYQIAQSCHVGLIPKLDEITCEFSQKFYAHQ